MKYNFLAVLLLIIITSCRTPQNTTYFRDISDSTLLYTVVDTGFKPLVIKSDDVLQVNVTSPNVEANSFFIMPGPSTAGTANTSPISNSTPNTYLVDKDGGIDLPLVGRIEVKGLTTSQAKNLIRSKVSVVLKEPIVTVRLQNFKVTVLGEVNKPANYIISNERVTILDAIGYAGDLTMFGLRENVMVIREQDGKKTFARVSLNSSKLFQSPYYYLQQNDIIYVEPNKSKVASTDVAFVRNITIITSLAGFAAIILSRIIF